MIDRAVVSCFLEHAGRIFLARRSDRVATYRGKWGTAAGGLPPGVEPLEQALREIEEETGLGRGEVTLRAQGEPFVLEDAAIGIRWAIHPFLFEAVRDDVRLDWEHVEHRWIAPESLGDFDIVPSLDESLRRVRPGR